MPRGSRFRRHSMRPGSRMTSKERSPETRIAAHTALTTLARATHAVALFLPLPPASGCAVFLSASLRVPPGHQAAERSPTRPSPATHRLAQRAERATAPMAIVKYSHAHRKTGKDAAGIPQGATLPLRKPVFHCHPSPDSASPPLPGQFCYAGAHEPQQKYVRAPKCSTAAIVYHGAPSAMNTQAAAANPAMPSAATTLHPARRGPPEPLCCHRRSVVLHTALHPSRHPPG